MMPSIKIERDVSLAVTVKENLKISVNTNCIMIQNDHQTVVHPASDITKITMSINRQLVPSNKGIAYDNSSIYIHKISDKYSQPCIETGPYTEKVYAFIMKHMYEMDGSDDEEDVSSVKYIPMSRTYGSWN